MIVYEVYYDSFGYESYGIYLHLDNAENKLFSLQDIDQDYADCYGIKPHLVVDGEVKNDKDRRVYY